MLHLITPYKIKTGAGYIAIKLINDKETKKKETSQEKGATTKTFLKRHIYILPQKPKYKHKI